MSSTAFAAPVVPAVESVEAEPMGWRAAPLPPPNTQSRKFTAPSTPRAVQAMTNVFFLNYDGVSVKYTGDDDATRNETAFEQFEADYEPYGDGPKRAASLQAVKSDWADYDVKITDERPESGEYTMSINSPTNVIGPGVLGVAMLDCNDQHAASNVVLAFHSADDKFSASTQATTISQEIAHAYGLEHVNEPDDIMNPYNAGGNPSFRDECLQLDPNTKVLCGEQHQQFCDKGQNSHQELIWLFGSSAPDAVPPTISITAPQDGAEFEAPATITITAEAADDVGVAQVDLYINDADQHAPRMTAPYEWTDATFPEGHYCLTVEASDADNKTMSAPVCFTVAKAAEGTTGGGEPSTTSGGDGETGAGDTTEGLPGTSGDETGVPETTGEPDEPDTTTTTGGGTGDEPDGYVPTPGGGVYPPSFGGEHSDDGCGCRQDTRPGAAGMLLALVAFAARRRRRG